MSTQYWQQPQLSQAQSQLSAQRNALAGWFSFILQDQETHAILHGPGRIAIESLEIRVLRELTCPRGTDVLGRPVGDDGHLKALWYRAAEILGAYLTVWMPWIPICPSPMQIHMCLLQILNHIIEDRSFCIHECPELRQDEDYRVMAVSALRQGLLEHYPWDFDLSERDCRQIASNGQILQVPTVYMVGAKYPSLHWAIWCILR